LLCAIIQESRGLRPLSKSWLLISPSYLTCYPRLSWLEKLRV
jgi:hypothetical protein